ncbi:TonB-dependent receptor [Rhizorhapis sp. SPR117]|uniref:TonB-dependent receptor n=1 Tax=Rhizorhapis sp. SPR117 TaxID=2912611 RepID=UPI001F44C4AD|nr:TonB-dependent receptor [Rhizorhapis sp. SPR117]
MSINPAARPLLIAPCSIAAAMIMAGPAFAADADMEAARQDGIHVDGERQEIDLPTVRGPIIDVPQMVNSITSETLRDRQITSLEQALRNVAGVTTQVGEGGALNGDQFTIRGQSAKNDIFTDGLRDFGVFTRDAFNYESVEVLKGSSSTALGRGVTGGAINTTSKQPHTTDFFSATGGYGTGDYGRITVDANKALTDTIGLRLNFMAHDNDAVDRDEIYARRWGFAPAIGFGLGTDTSFTLIYFHQEENKLVDYGVPFAQTTDPDDMERPVTEFGVPRSNFYGFGADRDDVVVNTVTGKFSHRAGDWLTVTSDTKLGVYKRSFRQTVPGCRTNENCGDFLLDGDPATVPVARTTPRGAYFQTTKGIQNVTALTVAKPLGAMRNELVIGWDMSYQTNDRSDQVRPDPYEQDLFNPVRSPLPNYSTAIYSQRDSRATDISLFIDDRLWLTPKFSINAGLRFQHYKATQEQIEFSSNTGGAITSCNGVTGTYTTCFEEGSATHDLWSPKVSAIWEPSKQMTFYATYSRASNPPGNSVANGDTLQVPADGGSISRANLDPERTETFDLGGKLNLFHKRLLIQTAVYQINRKNSVEIDPVTNSLIASSEPKQRLRGFELSASGMVTPDIMLNVNYAYVDAEIRSSAAGELDPEVVGNQVRYVPEHALSAWANYKPVEGPLKGLEVGGGLNYQSRVYANVDNSQVVPSYTTFDALIGYSFGNYRIAVNGYNLTDELYYAQVNGGRVVPAGGRAFVATFGVAF